MEIIAQDLDVVPLSTLLSAAQCFRGHAYLTEATLMRRFQYTKTSAMLRPCNHHKCG